MLKYINFTVLKIILLNTLFWKKWENKTLLENMYWKNSWFRKYLFTYFYRERMSCSSFEHSHFYVVFILVIDFPVFDFFIRPWIRYPVPKSIKIEYLSSGTARRTWPAPSRWWTSVQPMIRIRKWTWPACSPRRAGYRYHDNCLCTVLWDSIFLIFTKKYGKEQEQ